MKLANMNLDREKQELESKKAEMEAQKATTEQQVEQYEVQIAGLEARNSSFEVLLKAQNDQKTDLEPLTKHALLLRGGIYQMQVQIAEEVFKIRQVEARLQEISTVATTFKERTRDIAEILQGQLTWLEINTECPENTPKKCPKQLQIECDIVNFSSRVAERLRQWKRQQSNVHNSSGRC